VDAIIYFLCLTRTRSKNRVNGTMMGFMARSMMTSFRFMLTSKYQRDIESVRESGFTSSDLAETAEGGRDVTLHSLQPSLRDSSSFEFLPRTSVLG
jgi:hypothetical protein